MRVTSQLKNLRMCLLYVYIIIVRITKNSKMLHLMALHGATFDIHIWLNLSEQKLVFTFRKSVIYYSKIVILKKW